MGYKIVLADDQDNARQLYSGYLADCGHEVVTYESGTEVFNELIGDAPDIVVTDLQMPPGEWGGLWLIGQIRKTDRSLPIVVLSEKGQARQAAQAYEAGGQPFTTYVEKSRAKEELPTAIQELMQAVRAQSTLLEAYTKRLSSYEFWENLTSNTQRSLANAEYLFHTNFGALGFDFSGAMGFYAKALEIELHAKVVPMLKGVSSHYKKLLVQDRYPLESYSKTVSTAEIIKWLRIPGMNNHLRALGVSITQPDLLNLAKDLDYIRRERNPRVHATIDESTLDVDRVRAKLLGVTEPSVFLQTNRFMGR